MAKRITVEQKQEMGLAMMDALEKKLDALEDVDDRDKTAAAMEILGVLFVSGCEASKINPITALLFCLRR